MRMAVGSILLSRANAEHPPPAAAEALQAEQPKHTRKKRPTRKDQDSDDFADPPAKSVRAKPKGRKASKGKKTNQENMDEMIGRPPESTIVGPERSKDEDGETQEQPMTATGVGWILPRIESQ